VQLQAGTVFAGDYRVVRPLSAGGMGAVFVVQQLSTGKLRALKVMHEDLVYDAVSRQRFEQEARIGSRIASEHVVEVQAAGVDADTRVPYLVMELLEGEDMATRLERGPFTPQEALVVVEQLAHAMGAAHDAGVVHRDLKPENIFLAVPRRSGVALTVKILDFGIAKVAEGRNTTTASGTPLWLAPEQTSRSAITPAADVWAIGLLVFDMLAGRVFWRFGAGPNQSLAGLLGEIMADPIPYASQRAAEYGRTLPPGFDAWFMRCVVRDPNQRYQHARAAFTELAPILRVPPPAVAPAYPAHVPAYPTHVPAYAPPKPSSGCGTVVVVLLLFLLVVGGAVVWGIYALVKKGEEVADETVNVFASAAASAVALPESGVYEPPPPPTSSTKLRLNGYVSCGTDNNVQNDAQHQFNSHIATELDACFAPIHAKSLSIVLTAELSADGSVARVNVPMGPPGQETQCAIDVIRAARFPATKPKTQVMFMLTW